MLFNYIHVRVAIYATSLSAGLLHRRGNLMLMRGWSCVQLQEYVTHGTNAFDCSLSNPNTPRQCYVPTAFLTHPFTETSHSYTTPHVRQ